MVYDLGIIKRQRYVEPNFIGVGGTVTTATSGSVDYVFHTFTTSSIFAPVYNVTAECLIVAGGGAGSGIAGGGAGGYRELTISFQKNNTFAITIGQGGTTATTTGYDSSIIGNNVSYTANGGGAGGQPGGSGGGGIGSAGSGAAGNTPSTSPSQGSAGGDSAGGGAGGAGNGTIGGSGRTWLNGVAYAGGGSGGGGASAGGGHGGSANGTPNTGGGGSVGNFAGGSGIVIIRYRKYVASVAPAFDASFAYTSLLLSNQSTSINFSTTTVNMLLIGGGGGGGGGGFGTAGGGGGAGGLYLNSFSPTLSTTLIVTMGAGGAGADLNTRFATQGTSSTVRGKQPLGGDASQTITATGGGAGQSYSYEGTYTSNSATANGGSGGSSPGGTAGSSTLPENDGPNYFGHAGVVSYGGYGPHGGGAGTLGSITGSGGLGKYISIGSSSTFSQYFAYGGGHPTNSYSGYIGGSGGSGSGGGAGSGPGGTGGGGLAFFWHLSSLPMATFGNTNAYTISFQDGYTIYAFLNGSGTITFGPQWSNSYLKNSSVMSYPVQRHGNVLAQGAFNPFSPNWSTYFNGTTDYLSIQHSDAFNISSDFTLEGWFYATSSTNSTIISKSITSVGTMNLSPFEITLSSQNTLTTAVSLINPAPTYAVEYLVVAGGGGGAGAAGGGGGGAGGFRTGIFTVTQTSTSITVTVTVGAGGATGSTGQNSSIIGGGGAVSITSLGGGGGSGTSLAGLNGGSGGGGSTGGLGTVGQGNNGGSGTNTAGGGGGAGGVGGPGASQVGGPGLSSSISGSNVAYAGGGGGGGSQHGGGYFGAVGGVGGGGTGGGLFGGGGSAGTAGLGGGGGGDAAGGQAGGGGVVFISYSTNYEPASYTGSPTITTSGGNRIYQFLTGGTITLIIPLYPKYTISTSQVNNNTWNHISLSRSGPTYRSILNGTDLQILNLLPATVEYLVVAGGGGGGGGHQSPGGSGGGAGGYRTASGFDITPGTPITVTVGAGGTAGTGNGNGTPIATKGGDSVFSTITSTGGGAGSYYLQTFNASIHSGGSGGGAFFDSGTAGSGNTPSTTPSQGNNGGGTAGGTTVQPSSGGGGAGGAGTTYGSGGGAGGAGSISSISGSSITYAGGGGGGAGINSSPGGTATGGGGAGGNSGVNGSAGSPNTGGGGGGAGETQGGIFTGGDGGSGVVIIRYADTYPAGTAPSTTGSPTVTVAGGYRVYKWTTSGSITWPTIQSFPIYNNTATIYIGYDGANYFQGYISNLRFLNGISVIALPKLPFPLIDNTALLVSASGTRIDKSSYNFTVGQNGTPAIRKFSPFVNPGPYNTLVSGGSIYFNGSTDFISVNPNAVDFQNNSFNIEFWSYPEPIATTAYFIDSRYNTSGAMAFGSATTSTNDGMSLALQTSGLCTISLGTSTTFTSINLENLRVKFRAWNHIAVVRNNTLLSLYINGNYAGSTSTSVTITTVKTSLYTAISSYLPLITNNVSIGRSSYLNSGYYKGYLSNLHIMPSTTSTRATYTAGTLNSTIEYLIVAGGGGGGAGGYGGGGGGFRYGSFITTSSGATYNITVGSGGGTTVKGGDSSIIGGGINITSAGGGAASAVNVAGSGGSGSGNYGTGNTPSTSPPQGYDGGLRGGGGAGSAGSDLNGGTGSTSTITGSSLMYAGGGGGNNTTGALIGGNGGAGGGGAGWATLTFEYLVVAGGGAGGTSTGGGGGGGGFLTSNFISTLTGVTYVVTVGGAGQNTSMVGGGFNILAYAGGAGGYGGGTGYPGGSGGGWNGAVIVVGQGNVGGTSGGGGAGAPGGYHGGNGLQSNIDGFNYYYSGGGGVQSSGGTGGNGGLGGGGGGTGFNFGGAGGGGRNTGANFSTGGTNTGGGGSSGQPGGSGIIIIRYAGTQVCTGGSVSTVGTYTVHTFLTSGSLVENVTGGTTRIGTAGIRGNLQNGGTNTGGGGGGGGTGGSGIVAIRYPGQPRGFGGNITTNVYGLYTVHTFLASDTYVDSKTTYTLPYAPVTAAPPMQSNFNIYYMAVGGGGAGGGQSVWMGGGGGGAGGLTVGSFIASYSTGLITITVGAGGVPGSYAGTGQDSQIIGVGIPPNLLAKGGGGGGGWPNGQYTSVVSAGAGGSGGGAGGADASGFGIATQNTAFGRNGSGIGYGEVGAPGQAGAANTGNGGGGGGGGAGIGRGSYSGNYTFGPGVNGLYVNVANSSTYSGTFAKGGNGGQNIPQTGGGNGTANTGNGGDGAYPYGSTGSGGNGKIILWHTDTLSISPIVVGATGVYTTNSYKVYVFNTSGTIEFKYSNTSLLLNADESKIFDATTQNNIYQIGDVSVSTSIIKYNPTSMYFDGDGDGLGIGGSTSTTTATNLTAVGSGNFTVEMWMYPLSLYNTATAPALLDSRTTSTSVAGSAYLGYTGVTVPTGSQIGWKDNTSFVTTGTVIINTWNYVSVIRSGSTLTMYINGAVTSSTTNTTNYTIPFKYIGISYDLVSFKGYIDDLRITLNARTGAYPETHPQLK